MRYAQNIKVINNITRQVSMRNHVGELSDEKMLLAREIGRARWVDVMPPRLFDAGQPQEESWMNTSQCDFPFKFMAVELDGKIGLCCGTQIRRGNIFRDGFAAMWNDPFWVRLRETVNTADEPLMCRDCTLCKQKPDLVASHIPNAELAAQMIARHAEAEPMAM